jgi:hypothetical protein
MAFSPRVDADEIGFHEPDAQHQSDYGTRLPIGFSWLVERYDFDRIEEYVDEYYTGHYKNWEKFLTTKQREFAGRFGLSNIFVRPDFNCYENTKIALTKGIWNDRLLFRYLAPVRNIEDFEVSVAIRPQRFVTFLVKSERNGEQRVVLVINRPLGHDKNSEYATRRLRWLLGHMKRLGD